jgi:hypothetical protein
VAFKEEELDREARLAEALLIVLEEAGSRKNPTAAMSVITNSLNALTDDYPEIGRFNVLWNELLVSDLVTYQQCLQVCRNGV